jgi:hypothetical protein
MMNKRGFLASLAAMCVAPLALKANPWPCPTIGHSSELVDAWIKGHGWVKTDRATRDWYIRYDARTADHCYYGIDTNDSIYESTHVIESPHLFGREEDVFEFSCGDKRCLEGFEDAIPNEFGMIFVSDDR